MDTGFTIDFDQELESLESLLNQVQLPEAEVLAIQLLEQAKSAKHITAQVRALNALGDIQSIKAQFVTALETYFLALQLSLIDVENEVQAKLHNSIAITYGNSGLLEDGLRHYGLACRFSAQPKNRLRFEMNAALVHGNLGRWDDALNIFQAALSAGQLVLEPVELLRARQSLIYIQTRIESNQPEPRVDVTQTLLSQAFQLADELASTDFKDIKAEIHEVIADVYMLRGELPNALLQVQKSLELIRPLNLSRMEMSMLVVLAMIETKMSQAQAALESLQKALVLGQQMGGKGLTAQVHQQFCLTYEALGDYQTALHHHRLFYEIDSEKKSALAATRASILMTRIRLEQSEMNAKLEHQRAEDLEILNRQLEALSRTDVLTGLANRRAFNETLAQMLEQAKRQELIFSVAMLDLDHFKQINDTYTHLVGDAVLIQAAQILEQQRRASDVVARFGGEEFVMIFFGVSGQDAFLACERIRLAFAQFDWRLAHPDLQTSEVNLTISIGLCSQPQDTPEGWLKQADIALYQAKASGRNQVFVL